MEKGPIDMMPPGMALKLMCQSVAPAAGVRGAILRHAAELGR